MIPNDLLLSFFRNLEESIPVTDLFINLSGSAFALFLVLPDFLVPLMLSIGPTLLILRAGIRADINTVTALSRIMIRTAKGVIESSGSMSSTAEPSKLNSFCAIGPAQFAPALTTPRPAIKPIGKDGIRSANASK